MIRSAAVLILVGVTILLISGLPGARPAAATLGPVVVEITDDGYNPPTLAIPSHTTVTWTNRGTVDHTVSGDSGGPDSPILAPRYSYSYTFHNEGTFAYHDGLHAELSASIVVAEGTPLPSAPISTSTPDATPTPAPTATPTPTAPSQPTAPTLYAVAPSSLAYDSSPTIVRQQTGAAGVLSAPDDPSGPEAPESVPASASAVTVDMGNEWYGEVGYQNGVYAVTVQTGDTVQWNVTEGIHNVYECGDNWSNVSSSCDGAAWHSDQVLTSGSTFTYTFDTAGTFYYLCTIHPQTMRGKVVVEAGNSSGEDPTPTPVADDTNSGDVSAGGDDNSDTDALAALPSSADNPAAVSDTAVAGEAALPNGGGAPPIDRGMPTTPFFVAAAIAFAAGGLIFWRWKQVSA